MAKNKSYDEEFKKMIVELYESHTTTAANIVREYGIGSATLYKWVGQYGKIQTADGEVTNNKEIKKLKKEINGFKPGFSLWTFLSYFYIFIDNAHKNR